MRRLMTQKPVKVELNLFPETRDDLNALAHMYGRTPSQLVAAFITSRKAAWFKAMNEPERKRLRDHKIDRAEAKLIGMR
jgi:hypothetical protein